MAKCGIMQTTPHDSPGTLVKDLDIIPMGSPQWGRQIQVW